MRYLCCGAASTPMLGQQRELAAFVESAHSGTHLQGHGHGKSSHRVWQKATAPLSWLVEENFVSGLQQLGMSVQGVCTSFRYDTYR
jgi:hypothetical protein